MRFFKNVSKEEQKAVGSQFAWLLPWFDPMRDRTADLGLRQVWLSVFDHWLNQREAHAELNDVDRAEQVARDARFYKFAVSLAVKTDMLAFAWRGRKWKRLQFRRFTNVVEYFDPGSDRSGRRCVILPAFDALLIEGYDDTWHLIFRTEEQIAALLEEAATAGLHVLGSAGDAAGKSAGGR